MYSGIGTNGSGVSDSTEVIRSLTLDGYKGRVRAVLSRNQLSFESKTGHALDLQLSVIQRVHHSHTNLIPGWLALIGVLMIWLGFRTFNGEIQAMFAAGGIVMCGGHLLTRRPTLILDTKAGDCHSVFGNDTSLMRLGTILQRLKDGANMEEARKGLDLLNHDSDYPRSNQIKGGEIEETLEIFPNPVIGAFLNEIDQTTPREGIEADIEPLIPDLDLPSWLDENEPVEQAEKVIPEGLLQRSRENIHTRRFDSPSPQGSPTAPYPGVYRQEAPFSTNHNAFSDPSLHFQEKQPGPIFSPAPEHYLPSFVGADGAHIPGYDSHNDSNLQDFQPRAEVLDAQQPEISLVARARMEHTPNHPVIADDSENAVIRYPTLTKLSQTSPSSRRLTTSSPYRKKARRSIVKEIFRPPFGKNLGRIFSKVNRTGEALRMRANRNKRANVIESIQKMSENRDGPVSKEHISAMTSHLGVPVKPIPASFDQLVESEELTESLSAKIPRIED